MKFVTILATSLFASFIQADIFKCTFTEPFITTTYSTPQSTLTYESSDPKIEIIKNVSLQIKAAGVFELVAKNGKVLQTLTLNNQGSDGMSNAIYPYDVKDSSQVMTVNAAFGGCQSNDLKSKQDGGQP